MIIQIADKNNFSPHSLDSFSRHQTVRISYRIVNGALEEWFNPFEETWDLERRREKAAEILSGDFITYAAFEEGKVLGQILLIPKLYDGRLVVDSFHVDEAYRRKGIGRALFEKAKEEGLHRGAHALYISACQAKETIDFYLAMGCRISENPIAVCVEAEPFDIQLECPLT